MDRIGFIRISTALIGGVSLGCMAGQAKRPEKVRIGLITDLHYADRTPPPGLSRYYSESLAKLAECVEVMNREKVDMLVQLGDFKDEDIPPTEETTLSYLATIEQEFSRFDGPYYHVPGNHDHDSISKQQYLDAISNTGFEKALCYYSFNRNGYHFIVLDANYTTAGEPYDHGNFDWKDTAIPEQQLDWLKGDLKEHRDMPAVVFVHQRLDYISGKEDHFVKNAWQVREILEASGNVLMVLQGHDHAGAFSRIGNIVYYTLKAAVEGSGPENNSYAILEIDPDKGMHLTGFRRTESRSFS